MHSYHIFFQKGRGLDWSFICQNHGEKSKNTSNCSFFFYFLPLSFFKVFLSPSITSVWQVPDGLRGENNVLWPSVPPSSSAPGFNSFSQQAVGGGLATAPLPASPLLVPPFYHHHQNQSLCDTIQTIHRSPCITVQCTTNNDWPCGSGVRKKEPE